MSNQRSRAGFSLIEALVVLAIGGMALAIVFGVGTSAGDAGFRLGRRALTVADSDIAASDLRSVLRSVLLRPAGSFEKDVDRPIVASATMLEADVVMERATQCAPEGWAGRLTLQIQTQNGKSSLVCTAGARRSTLMDLGTGHAAFSYLEPGAAWTTSFTNADSAEARVEVLVSRTLWIRFKASRINDIVEEISSGRPEAWIRPDAAL